MKLSTKFFTLAFIQGCIGSIFMHSWIWIDNDKFGKSGFVLYSSAAISCVIAAILKDSNK